MRIDVLYQFDDKYAPYGGVSIYSLFCSNRHFSEINVYILDNQVSEGNKEKLFRMAEQFQRRLVFLDASQIVSFMEEAGIPKYRGSYSTNMKLFAQSVLPVEIEKMIYIDSDTLVVGKLDGIVSFDMGDKPLAMTIDSIARGHKKHIGFSKDDEYHNAGVMVFNMRKWREKRCMERITEHVKKVRAHYLAPDQDLVNIVLKSDIVTIAPEYDFQPLHRAFSLKTYYHFFSRRGYYSPAQIEEAAKHPVILHFFRFMGEFPWNRDNVHPYGKEFDYYLRQSPWKDYQKEPAGGSWIFMVEKWMYRHLPAGLFLLIFKINYEYFMFRANRLSLKNKNHQNM